MQLQKSDFSDQHSELFPGLVSIVIPVFNAESFLRRSIESALSQSHENLELLLINDGSTDSSEDICRDYSRTDSRIRVISQENGGPAAARNNGIRHASGEYIFFLDADDYILPHALQTLVSAYREYNPDLVICNFAKQVRQNELVPQRISFTPDNEPFEGRIKRLRSPDFVLFVRHFFKYPSNHLVSYCWARLYKTAILRKHTIFSHEEMRLFEDFVLNLDYMSSIESILFLNDPLYVYVMHSNHISASMAIINSKSLIHDMIVFGQKAGEFLHRRSPGSMSPFDIQREVGHTLIHYLIIFIVRSCLQIRRTTRARISREIRAMVEHPLIQESLRAYCPMPGTSRILPFLMKLKLVGLIMLVGRLKARQRYGRQK